jgi:hypothetical protein
MDDWEPASFANKSRDLETLQKAVVDAATVGAGFWLSYLFLLFYFLIAVAGVTHRDLFFENPVKLPFLGVDLPLTGFFWLGPIIFIIAHTYVLLHFVLLADKVGVFHAELRAQIGDEDVRTRLRRQLPSNLFVQFRRSICSARGSAWVSIAAHSTNQPRNWSPRVARLLSATISTLPQRAHHMVAANIRRRRPRAALGSLAVDRSWQADAD